MDALEGILQSFTPEEKKEAAELENKIEEITNKILEDKKSLDSNFVKLSSMINEIRQKKYWVLGSFRTFGDYIESIEKKFNIKHSQLYVGMKVVRNLLPNVSEKELVDIGITKAGILSKYVEQSGQSVVPDELLQTAKDKTSEQLDAEVNSKLHNVTLEKGQWFNLGGFFADESEKQEILDALSVAKNIDPVVSNSIPNWQQQKEAFLRLAREFLSTYS